MINSLSLAVWDTDKRRGTLIKEQVEMFSEREAALYHEVIDDDTKHDVFFLSFSEAGEPVVKTARTVRLSGEDVYMLLIGKRGSDFVQFFRPTIRPNGVMFHPVKSAELRDMFIEMSSEIRRLRKEENDDVLVLKSEGVTYRIQYKDVLFFEASAKRINLHTKGQQISYYESIENLSAILPKDFVRCHRSYIVNIANVLELHGADMELRLSGGYSIPFSRTYRNDVRQAMATRG